MGGPLGKGTIENGKLICPWHGWGFNPFTGEDPDGAHAPVATFPVEEREDGVYVKVEEVVGVSRTISNVMVETMINWGITHVFGMVGFSILGMADAVRRQVEKGNITYIGIRHEGAAAFACSGFAKLSGRPAACMTIAGPGVFQEIDLAAAFNAVSEFSQQVLRDSNHVELMSLALKHAVVERNVAHLIFPDEVQLLDAPVGAEASSPSGRVGATDIAPPAGAGTHDLQGQGTASRQPSIGHGRSGREWHAGVELVHEPCRPDRRLWRLVFRKYGHRSQQAHHPG